MEKENDVEVNTHSLNPREIKGQRFDERTQISDHLGTDGSREQKEGISNGNEDVSEGDGYVWYLDCDHSFTDTHT